MRIFTLGYQGISLSDYIEALDRAAIDVVIDIRETAWSYKPGFSKAPLSIGLHEAGIRYIHLKSAGNPSKNRKTARNSQECLRRYKQHLLKNPGCLDELSELIEVARREKQRICLTCFEKHATECHRSVLIGELVKRIRHLSPVHLFSEIKDHQPVVGTTRLRL